MDRDQQGLASGAPGALARLPRPLLRQLVLLVPVLIDLVVNAVAGRLLELGWFYVAGLALLVAVTAATTVNLRQLRLSVAVMALLPVLDLAAIGLMRLVPEGNGIAVLAVLPGMWLASDLRMRGAAVTAVAVPLLVSLPGVVYFGLSPATVSRAITVTAIAIACAVTVAGTTDVWRRQNAELEAQRRRLATLVDEMRATRARHEAVVTTVDVGLLALDREGRFTYSNPRLQEFLHLAYPDGHLGVAGQLGEMYSDDQRTRLTIEGSPCILAMGESGFSDYVVWIGRPGEEQRALSVSSASVLDADGRPDGAVLAYHDITDLMAALRVKDEFVASVSHELRTPLTSILGFLEIAVDDPTISPSVLRQLEAVIRNAQRLQRLVGDLLLSAQVEAGQLALEAEPVDLSALVSAAVLDQRPAAEQRGVALSVEVPERLDVLADPGRMAQTVENLVSNAVKYTSAGGEVLVTLSADEDRVVLAVSDTGMGISTEDQEQLFTRFFRTRQAQAQAIQGVGLGLAITRSIVEAHGGRIDVESELGEGATFRVTLPTGAATIDGHGSPGITASGASVAGAGAPTRGLPPA